MTTLFKSTTHQHESLRASLSFPKRWTVNWTTLSEHLLRPHHTTINHTLIYNPSNNLGVRYSRREAVQRSEGGFIHGPSDISHKANPKLFWSIHKFISKVNPANVKVVVEVTEQIRMGHYALVEGLREFNIYLEFLKLKRKLQIPTRGQEGISEPPTRWYRCVTAAEDHSRCHR